VGWRRQRGSEVLAVLTEIKNGARRTQLGKSQEQLARDSSLHWSYLGQVERGQRNLTLHNILKLAEVLEIDPGELVHGLRAP
jgi:transcriptional regulator with XRE-family HTH domain